MSARQTAPPEVFISYAREDARFKEGLVKQLKTLERQGIISAWHDGLLVAGQKWDEVIVSRLDRSRLILFLVSPDFADSDYIHRVELKRASERHAAGEVSVIPVLIRNVHGWRNEPFGNLKLGDFQALPSDTRFVTEWGNRDKAFADVAAGIERAVEELKPKTAAG
ncbi:MAG TPA: toll/interleukin-1 receptor domain-containing protein, partial [Pyrinomonadaceae bacterium]|nr:toll/interleukin-1 receptor domain-containing protein [Pyrinomonadaceae bacterium]